MNEFDNNIIIISDNICNNIASIPADMRGFLSQNILNNLRNLVEAVDQRIYSDVQPITLNCYSDIEKSIKYVASRGNLKFLSRFHDFLQASVSHYTPDEDSSIRLMLKYYEWLIRIRDYCKKAFNIEILQNLEDYPLNQDDSLQEYYEKIAAKLDCARYHKSTPNQRYYIHKNKPFFIAGKVYYEITIISADDYSSKFNRFTVFSKREIPSYYSIKLDFIESSIDIINRKMPILIVNNFQVSIRPIELEDIATILGVPKVNTGTKEYGMMMDYLTGSGFSFTEIIDFEENYYQELKQEVSSLCGSNNTFVALDKCREFSQQNKKGHNIIRYLLLRLRHNIMKQQIAGPNNWISYLALKNECLPFENMPFDASLVFHNPSLFDVFTSIKKNGHEEELLSRRVRINTEQKVLLFTPMKDVEGVGDVPELSQKFNARLIGRHQPIRSLVLDDEQIYIKGYVSDTVWIINDLLQRKQSGLPGYQNAMRSWIIGNSAIDCEEKKRILPEIFANSSVAMIYGAAGTGKTTLIKYIADFFADEKKLFLANTNPAKEHLRREITIKNSEYSTIASSHALINNREYDIVFVDECSTVDNFSMKNLLMHLQCKLLVLVGDVYQIQSIKFGNWFGLARYFLPADSIYELTTPFRSRNDNLKELWNRVRKLDDQIAEYINRNRYASVLNDSLFRREADDEIILCLNYDGLYGINNINRFLQNDNPNPPVVWDSWTYKVGDPIIFNENNRFYPILYNNLKGWIRGIEKSEASITFTIEVDMIINWFGAADAGFDLLECDVAGHSMIRFSVNNYADPDGEERKQEQVVPFQIAYAISIHKAQGLEYDSVKIVVTNELEERITHNIFYTAITRAISKLKIYWTPETQQKILSEITPISNKRDACILAAKHNLKILNTVEQVVRQ